MRLKRKPWTAEENEQLMAIIAKGYSPFLVSAALKRNLISVRGQARKLGLAFPSIRQTRRKLHQAIGKQFVE
jgi:hypothetical protein